MKDEKLAQVEQLLEKLQSILKNPFGNSFEYDLAVVFKLYEDFFDKHSQRRHASRDDRYLCDKDFEQFYRVLKLALEKTSPTKFC